MAWQRMTVVALTALVLGCGHEGAPTAVTTAAAPPQARPATPPAPRAAKKPPKGTPTTAKPVPGKPAATAGTKPSPAQPALKADAWAYLLACKSAIDAVPSMKGEAATKDYKLDGSEHNEGQFTLSYQAPNLFRIDMNRHTRKQNVGGKTIIEFGSPNVQVKPAGILSLITLSLPQTDSRLTSSNGWVLDDQTTPGILGRLTGDGYKADIAGTTTIGGDKVTMMKLTTDLPHKFGEKIGFEHLGFDENKLFRYWAIYAKPELGLPADGLVFSLTIQSVQTNVSFPTSHFKL